MTAGSVNPTPIHVVDWLPTLLTVAGGTVEHETDGVDLTPVFRGESIPERPLYWYLPLYDLRWASTPAAVIRQGKWKLIEYFGDRFDANQQYHIGQQVSYSIWKTISVKPTELAALHADRVIAMRQQLLRWIESIPAEIPKLNPHYDQSKAFQETKEKQPWNE